jgi:hypothetical protein
VGTSRHSLLARLAWHPVVAGVVFLYSAYRFLREQGDSGDLQIMGVVAVWLGISIYDWSNSHRWLNWLFADDQPPAPPAR